MLPILNPPPSPHHPSGSSQCTSPKHPVSCIEPGLATRFIHDITHVSIPFSQIYQPKIGSLGYGFISISANAHSKYELSLVTTTVFCNIFVPVSSGDLNNGNQVMGKDNDPVSANPCFNYIEVTYNSSELLCSVV